jgi:hypothetical protein
VLVLEDVGADGLPQVRVVRDGVGGCGGHRIIISDGYERTCR